MRRVNNIVRIIEDVSNEIPKYRKKKQSSKSKSFEKSKHKHEYVDCLLVYKVKPYKANYCKICGKIGDLRFAETEKVERNGELYHRVLGKEEVFSKYKDLECIEVDDIWDKYIPISKGE